MIVQKVFNNNVLLVHSEENQEMIVMGRGLGFQKKAGDRLDHTKIEKTYVLESAQDSKDIQALTQVLPQDEADVFLEILLTAEKALEQTFDSSFFLALTDHLHYAIERHREGLPLQNPLSWEIRKFYPKEYHLGQNIITLLNHRLAIALGDEEAASVALHLVNAQKDNGIITKHQSLTKLTTSILDMIRWHYGLAFDEESLSYSRFITHVRYFGQRVLQGEIQGDNDAFLYNQVRTNYPKAFVCTQKIASHVLANYAFEMSLDEQVYMTIHIQRLTS